ncbi:MAG TPA: amino acid ABC transporter permease [Burkholderiaceae bacterium]
MHAPVALRPSLRTRLFGSAGNGLATLVLGGLLLALLVPMLHWGLWRAHWSGDALACAGGGACWAVVAEKYRLILFGRYPFEAHWRPLLASLLLLAMLVASCRAWLRGTPLRAGRWATAWAAVLLAGWLMMRGGVAGLALVETDRWGGLPLTLLLATVSSALAFPLAVLLALGRQSALPAVRAACTVTIELVRGVPLVSVLFVASFMLPLLLPAGFTVDVLLRVLAGITLFAAAYMAEVVRGGLQAVPAGQRLAAQSLGMGYWQVQRNVVLPQALSAVLPALMNNFIAIFKDTSLVTIVSLYELTGALDLALNADALWRPYKLEGYLFIALVYFGFCLALSRTSERIAQRGARTTGAARA